MSTRLEVKKFTIETLHRQLEQAGFSLAQAHTYPAHHPTHAQLDANYVSPLFFDIHLLEEHNLNSIPFVPFSDQQEMSTLIQIFITLGLEVRL